MGESRTSPEDPGCRTQQLGNTTWEGSGPKGSSYKEKPLEGIDSDMRRWWTTWINSRVVWGGEKRRRAPTDANASYFWRHQGIQGHPPANSDTLWWNVGASHWHLPQKAHVWKTPVDHQGLKKSRMRGPFPSITEKPTGKRFLKGPHCVSVCFRTLLSPLHQPTMSSEQYCCGTILKYIKLVLVLLFDIILV